jgi:uncharacterized protein YndB with AHSA1/START domain
MTKSEFTFTWTLDAPAEDVFRAWTEPAELGWFYNDTMPTPDEPIEVDLRVGGAWRQRMVIDDDTSYTTGGIYREIVPGERLVFTWGAVGGWPDIDPERLDESPLVTVTLTEHDGKTELMVHVELPETFIEVVPPAWPAAVEHGWRDTVDRLARRSAATASIER